MILFFSGCAHQQIIPAAPSHAAIDSGVSTIQKNTSDADDDVQSAQTQIQTIVKTVTNTVEVAQFTPITQALTDAHAKNLESLATITSLTNNLAWYENDDKATHEVAATQATTITSLQKSVSWWRSKALWEAGGYLLILCAVALYFGGPWLGKIAGAVIKTP
jgi:hypothetical protein